jgi:hypothetical protein
VLSLLRRHRRFFLGTALAGLALRLFFVIYFPAVTDDSRVYADFASNWLQHGIYGNTQSGEIVPSDTRLPGYPGFLAGIFALLGPGSFRAVMLAQVLWIWAPAHHRQPREGLSPSGLRSIHSCWRPCPFCNYAAAVLTETLKLP